MSGVNRITNQKVEQHSPGEEHSVGTKDTYFHFEDHPNAIAEKMPGTGRSGSASASSVG